MRSLVGCMKLLVLYKRFGAFPGVLEGDRKVREVYRNHFHPTKKNNLKNIVLLDLYDYCFHQLNNLMNIFFLISYHRVFWFTGVYVVRAMFKVKPV